VPTWVAIAIGLPALVTLVILCQQADADDAVGDAGDDAVDELSRR